MNRITKKIISRIAVILLLCLIVFSFGNGQNRGGVVPVIEEETKETQELAPQVTNLDVLLVDRINDSQIRLSNCVLVLAGELKICEDSFTYNNTFVSGDLYKITILVELKDTE